MSPTRPLVRMRTTPATQQRGSLFTLVEYPSEKCPGDDDDDRGRRLVQNRRDSISESLHQNGGGGYRRAGMHSSLADDINELPWRAVVAGAGAV